MKYYLYYLLVGILLLGGCLGRKPWGSKGNLPNLQEVWGPVKPSGYLPDVLPAELVFSQKIPDTRPDGKGEWLGTNGSAVPVHRDGEFLWLLTAKHVRADRVNNCPILKRVNHSQLDLSLLKIRRTLGDPIPFAERQPIPGEKVTATGWMLGAFLTQTDGRIRRPSGQHGKGASGEMTCHVLPGASGGAVMNTKGELVGIISSLYLWRDPFGKPDLIPWLSFFCKLDREAQEWAKKSWGG